MKSETFIEKFDLERRYVRYREMAERLYPDVYLEPVNPYRWLFELSRRDNQGISINERVLGGIPHIEGTRLSVGQVLGRLHALGNVQDVAEYYSELNLSVDQVKEAISFAQDFVEFAGEPHQTYD